MNVNDKKNYNGISYYDEGKGKTILFLHGWGQKAESFSRIFVSLKGKYRCIALDLPGFGDSQEPTSTLDLDEYINKIIDFCKHSKIDNPIVIAHSFGARLAIKMAATSKITNSLILTGAAGIKPKRTISYKLKVGNYKFMKFLVNTPLYWQYKEDLLSSSGSEDYKNSSQTMKKVLINVVNEDLRDEIKKIKNKVLLFWGNEDEATPLSDAQIMNEDMENSKLIVVKGSHYAFIEQAEKFESEINKFLKGDYK